VGAHALSLKFDYTVPYHRVWLLIDQAFTGTPDEVLPAIVETKASRLDDYYRIVLAMAESIVVARLHGPHDFAESRRILADAGAQSRPIVHDKALMTTYRAALARIAAEHGAMAKIWAWWRRLFPMLPSAAN
jgi:hypothetical protein